MPLSESPSNLRKNLAVTGSSVVRGLGKGVVVATGKYTQLGSIFQATTVKKIIKPPLLLRMERLSNNITCIALLFVSVVFFIQYMQGEDLRQVFMLAVALVVSAIPEGLPAAITIALAVGMRRLAASNVIVRRLLAVESLGSCTFIASDKTGTLTVNEMTVRKITMPDGSHFDVTGEGVSSRGVIIPVGDGSIDVNSLDALCEAGILASEAYLQQDDYHGDRLMLHYLF